MRSKYFWLGAILLAIIPILSIDIALHNVQWQKEVREQIIEVTHGIYMLDREQKGDALRRIFETNKTIVTLVYIKGLAVLICLGLGVYFLRRYHQIAKPKLWVTIAGCIGLMLGLTAGKLVLPELRKDDKVTYLTLAPDEYSLDKLYNENFKGKVVYVDFWGPYCGPCLVEFRDYTPSLKNRYSMRNDIVYLYISNGNRYMWKQQIQNYNVKGYHVFVGSDQYEKLYRRSVNNANAQILAPHYLIIDKNGKIAVPNAHMPSSKTTLYAQLDKYLTSK